MARIPENPIPEGEVDQTFLGKWFEMAKKLKELKVREILARKEIFGKAFPDPQEGTNKYDLPDDYVLKGSYSLERSIDEGAFAAIKEQLKKEKVNPDKLVKWKPSLVKAEYNKLSDKKKKLFDQCLIIKPGSPSLEIVLPAKAKEKAKQ